MPFTQGKSGNPGGRPAGSQNKRKTQLREMIENFLVDNFEKVVEEINTLEAKDRVKFYCILLPYGLAKVKPEADNNIERLTERELDEIFEKLKHVAEQSIKNATSDAVVSSG